MTTPRRQSSLLAYKRIQTQLFSDDDIAIPIQRPRRAEGALKTSSKRVLSQEFDASDAVPTPNRPAKRPKPTTASRKKPRYEKSDLHKRLFTIEHEASITAGFNCHFPLRHHAVQYHRPILLQGDRGKTGRSALLAWFDKAFTDRSMPWRKAFVQPADYTDPDQLRKVLTQRAYEIFICEIMLQQTRVKTVIDYWTRWMEKWPTIYDLAKADEDEVMSAWRGLGYYSRCKRILEACKMIVAHPEWQGLMPHDAKALQTQIPGVGPYTAGAISSIVFGRPAPMVDGNVLRVLSRQLGLLGDIKADKTIIDLIWACATSLVETVALDATPSDEESKEPQPTDAPGRWGQALMELGATICTPYPDCSACPITATCRAYEEGKVLADAKGRSHKSNFSQILDIEDMCELCEPFTNVAAEEIPKKLPAKTSKQATLSGFFTSKTPKSLKGTKQVSRDTITPEALEVVISHVKKFPLKVAKKALREEETLVCAIQCIDGGSYLLQKRPEKGELVFKSQASLENISLIFARAIGWDVGIPKPHSSGFQ